MSNLVFITPVPSLGGAVVAFVMDTKLHTSIPELVPTVIQRKQNYDQIAKTEHFAH